MRVLGGPILLVLVLAVLTAACDSDSDAAVVTTQAAAAAGEVATDGVSAGPDSSDDHLATKLADAPVTDLSEQEIADLMLMREEEKLARDVYTALGEQWGVRTFSNIAGSEQKHMDAMLTLIDRYELVDPVGTKEPGVFTDPDLQALYDDLVGRGLQSLPEALVVGASIEDLDIADLAAAIAATDNEDIAFVYENLQRGSRNHMRAFARQLDKHDVAFTPTYMTIAEYEAIIGSPTEHGNA